MNSGIRSYSRAAASVVALVLIAAASSTATGIQDAPTISVAGDLLGHVLGTVSRTAGTVAVTNASIELAGSTPAGAWKSIARIDDRGFFTADLPFSAVGPVRISAADGTTNSVLTLDSGDLAKRLTPRPAKGSVNRLALDGKWSLVFDPPKDFLARAQSLKWSAINVPAHWEMEGFVCESGVGLYQRAFRIPKNWINAVAGFEDLARAWGKCSSG
jgi:hypothetical protein